MKLYEGSAPCPPEDAGYVIASLIRDKRIFDVTWSYGRVHWKVDVPREEYGCMHELAKRIVWWCCSTHQAMK
jgi:hypothetical protein